MRQAETKTIQHVSVRFRSVFNPRCGYVIHLMAVNILALFESFTRALHCAACIACQARPTEVSAAFVFFDMSQYVLPVGIILQNTNILSIYLKIFLV